MGIYDREYYRDEHGGFSLGGDWSAVATLVVINVAVFVAELFTTARGAGSWVEQHLALQPDLFQHPWQAWQLLTYGFVHEVSNGLPWHIIFNMFGLWMFGTAVEGIYGRREFYKLYISLIILSGFFNTVVEMMSGHPAPLIGASGGVVGVAVIFACHFPQRLIYIYGIIPVPALVFVGLFVLFEFLQTADRTSNVAHWAHLGGAAFGFLYFRTGWSLFRIWPGSWSLRMPRRRTKLRVHDEDDTGDSDQPPDDYLTTGRIQKRVDELLEKISREGEASLTDEERQFLAEASRRYQHHRRR
jgi:membrane associated rhomboid family serine protease